MMATYQCRIDDRSRYPVLDAMADLFGKVRPQLLSDLLHGGSWTELKRDYQIRFGITARQFNAIAAEVRGKIAGVKELASVRMDEIRSSIRSTEKIIGKLEKREKSLSSQIRRMQKEPGAEHRPEVSAKRAKVRRQLHGKRRRLHALQIRLEQIQAAVTTGDFSICLGTKHLFDQQHHIGSGGAFQDHAAMSRLLTLSER